MDKKKLFNVKKPETYWAKVHCAPGKEPELEFIEKDDGKPIKVTEHTYKKGETDLDSLLPIIKKRFNTDAEFRKKLFEDVDKEVVRDFLISYLNRKK